jgi:hypothetical protein
MKDRKTGRNWPDEGFPHHPMSDDRSPPVRIPHLTITVVLMTSDPEIAPI